jgi:hypothetical protein
MLDALKMAVFFGVFGLGIIAVAGIYARYKEKQKDQRNSGSTHKSKRRRHRRGNS